MIPALILGPMAMVLLLAVIVLYSTRLCLYLKAKRDPR